MNKTVLVSAIALSLVSVSTIAVVPDQLPITSLLFKTTGNVYDAGGQFNQAGTVGPLNLAVDLIPADSATSPDNPPTIGRQLAPSFDQVTASGNIFSFDNFFFSPWEGIQQTPYLTNADSFAFVYDHAGSDCSAPSNVTKSSGPCTDIGSYDYDSNIAGMDDEQIAIGMFFNWSGNNGIPVLEIFDCDVNSICKGNGVPMATTPFSSQIALFNAGLACTSPGFASTDVDTGISVSVVADILGTDTPPSNCTNPTAVNPQDNPAGLKLDSVISPTANGGTVVINGANIDYTPDAGFEGIDKFSVNISDDTGDTTTATFAVQVGGQLQSNFTMLGGTGGSYQGTNDVDIVWDESTFNANDTVDEAGASTGLANGIPTDTTFGIMTIGSPFPFLNFNWFAHHVRIFQGPGTYKFDVTCERSDYDAGTFLCDKPLAEQKAATRFITMELAADEIGGHILFDWGKDNSATECGIDNCDIDVVNVWKRKAVWDEHGSPFPVNRLWQGPAGKTPDVTSTWELVSTDVRGYTDTDGVVHLGEGNGLNGAPMIDGAFPDNYANFNYKPDTIKIDDGEDPPVTEIDEVEVDGFSFSLWTLFAGLFSVLGLRRFNNKK